jgi:UTP:GlnB (protein PII) uridylyltransferase
MKRVPKSEGEYLVLVQPHLHHDGRRQWVVMATYDPDEDGLAASLAAAYRHRGHDVAVAQIVLEDDGYPYDNPLAKRKE